jgi:hypothetical protein
VSLEVDALNFHLDVPKIDNGQFQNWKLDQSIEEIQQVKGCTSSEF